MRFLPTEHRAFKEIIDSSKFDYSSFSFVKKKGWLSISHSNAIKPFRFHRKEGISLNDKGKWVEQKTYFYGMKEAIEESTLFKDVCSGFKSWLT